jgi:hypothetical protein
MFTRLRDCARRDPLEDSCWRDPRSPSWQVAASGLIDAQVERLEVLPESVATPFHYQLIKYQKISARLASTIRRLSSCPDLQR